MQVAINTAIPDVGGFLDHIVSSTNMRCLTPRSAMSGDCGFLAANLYAKSVFGEDALVNVSAEQLPDGKIGGYIRIRCVAGAKVQPQWAPLDAARAPAHHCSPRVPGGLVLQPSTRHTWCRGARAGTTQGGLASACLERLSVRCPARGDLPKFLVLRRSKTQGIALSLGDKLILKQKG